MGVKLTNEDFLERLKITNPDVKPLEPYVNRNTKIKYKCACNGIYEMKAGHLLDGHKCKKCGDKASHIKQALTQEEFVQRMSEINPNLQIVGKYVNSETKVECFCLKCKTSHTALASSLLKGKGCKKCGTAEAVKKTRKSHSEFMKEVAIANPNVEILGEYVGGHNPISFRCKKCNEVRSANPCDLIKGHGCIPCSYKERGLRRIKTHEEFVEEVSRINKDITIISKYESARTKIKYRCNLCNRESESVADSLRRGQACPYCSASKGEKRVREYLTKANISFEEQKKLVGCVCEKALLFDFYLKDYNLCIEYQGIQHYEPVDFASKGKEWADENFVLNQQRDQIKRDYCTANNINLLEIPYWDFDNIETILEKELRKCICA